MGRKKVLRVVQRRLKWEFQERAYFFHIFVYSFRIFQGTLQILKPKVGVTNAQSSKSENPSEQLVASNGQLATVVLTSIKLRVATQR